MNSKDFMDKFQTCEIEKWENDLGSFPLEDDWLTRKTRSTGEEINDNQLSKPGVSLCSLYEIPFTSERYN